MEKLQRLGVGNAPPLPSNSKTVNTDEANVIINKVNELVDNTGYTPKWKVYKGLMWQYGESNLLTSALNEDEPDFLGNPVTVIDEVADGYCAFYMDFDGVPTTSNDKICPLINVASSGLNMINNDVSKAHNLYCKITQSINVDNILYNYIEVKVRQ